MKQEELEHKIKRIEKFIMQIRFTLEEFNEMEGYLKEIQPSWEGCAHCPAKVTFGKTILENHLPTLRGQLWHMQNQELPSVINQPEMEVQYESPIETKLDLPPVPQGKVEVISTCKKCQKKNKTGM